VLGGFHPLASLGPHLLAVLRLRLHFVLGELAPMAIYHAKLWRLLLDMARPRALVSFNSSNDMIAPGILQAGPRGIATICCQHGVWGPYRLAGHLSPFDEVLVFGDYAREILGTIAEPQTRFTVTGHSVYDARAGDLPDGQRPVGQPPVVLATTQPVERHLSTGEACWWLDEVARGCAEAGAALWIKPHPEERDLSQYEDLARRMPETAVLVRHGERPLDDMIAACDLLVTRFSTTAMEANLQGVPVMTVNPAGGRDWYPYAEDGGGVGAHSCAEIAPLVVRALTDPQLRADLAASRAGFIERHLGRVDGHATERIAARIAARIARQS